MRVWDWVRIVWEKRKWRRGILNDVGYNERRVKFLDGECFGYLPKEVELLKKKDMPRYINEIDIGDIIETSDGMPAKVMTITDTEILLTRRGEIWNAIDRIARQKPKFFEMFAKQKRKVKEKQITLTKADLLKMMWDDAIIEWDNAIEIKELNEWDVILEKATQNKRTVVRTDEKYVYLAWYEQGRFINELLEQYWQRELIMMTIEKCKSERIKLPVWKMYITHKFVDNIIKRNSFVLLP